MVLSPRLKYSLYPRHTTPTSKVSLSLSLCQVVISTHIRQCSQTCSSSHTRCTLLHLPLSSRQQQQHSMDLNACGQHRACSISPAVPGAGPASAEPHTGTTIVACTFKGGVVLGADGRVSTGNYVSNRASNKITRITDNVYLLRSGSAADTQAVGDYVRYFAEQLSGELGRDPSVRTVANLVTQMNYNNKATLVGAMLVAGYDKTNGGQVFGIPIGGTLVEEEGWAIDGSGSTYIWGYMDGAWKPGMSRQEAETFVVEALALAMARDASSGGVIRTVTLDDSGATERYVDGNAVPVFHEELRPPAATSMVVG